MVYQPVAERDHLCLFALLVQRLSAAHTATLLDSISRELTLASTQEECVCAPIQVNCLYLALSRESDPPSSFPPLLSVHEVPFPSKLQSAVNTNNGDLLCGSLLQSVLQWLYLPSKYRKLIKINLHCLKRSDLPFDTSVSFCKHCPILRPSLAGVCFHNPLLILLNFTTSDGLQIIFFYSNNGPYFLAQCVTAVLGVFHYS